MQSSVLIDEFLQVILTLGTAGDSEVTAATLTAVLTQNRNLTTVTMSDLKQIGTRVGQAHKQKGNDPSHDGKKAIMAATAEIKKLQGQIAALQKGGGPPKPRSSTALRFHCAYHGINRSHPTNQCRAIKRDSSGRQMFTKEGYAVPNNAEHWNQFLKRVNKTKAEVSKPPPGSLWRTYSLSNPPQDH